MRKGLGAGQGRGYKNIVPLDPYIHSLSARGVKSASVLYAEGNLKFGIIPTKEKEGLIREIARKVHEGVDWAIQWEREHLPKQRRWVRKEYERAKEQIAKGIDHLKKDKDDVRDELDSNDDGVQDIPLAELHEVNTEIRQDLDNIDLNNDDVPDYVQEGDAEMTDYEIEYEEQKINFPLPTPTPHETFGRKVKKGVGSLVQKEREFVAQRRQERAELNNLSDQKLKELAVRNPAGLFGGNKYEKELLRRQTKRVQIEQKVSVTKQKAQQQPAKSGGGLGIDLGFLNPLSTFSAKGKKKK